MTGYVVDASVAVKWFVKEPLVHEAFAILSPDIVRVAPALLFAEASNALWARHRRGDLTRSELADAIQTLRGAPVSVPVAMSRLAPAAASLAAELEHPVYDCFYLALALREQFPVLTADTRFHDRVRRHAYLSESIVHLRELAGPVAEVS